MSTNSRRWKILVVDDYLDAADVMVDLLRIEGYEVAAAYHGRQAVEVARAFRPDLVLLDINMPVMDGYTAARTLRREQPPGSALVLIAHTANASLSDVQQALEAGFDRHVIKPMPSETLLGLIEAYAAKAESHSAPPAPTPRSEKPNPEFRDSA